MSAGDLPGLVRELGRTEGGPQTVAVLTAQQRARRLLLLRVLLDAVDTLPPTRLSPRAAAFARGHWRLLEAADRANPAATRQVLYYPLNGPWLEHCVRLLTAEPSPDPARASDRPADLTAELALLGPLAVTAAAQAGLTFTERLTGRAGPLVLPTLGRLHLTESGGSPVTVHGDSTRLTLQPDVGPPLRLHRGADGHWRTTDPGWMSVHVLPGGPHPVLLDDLDPHRGVDSDLGQYGMRASGVLTPSERGHWRRSWDQALSLLSLGGPARTGELALLHCIVPLVRPGESGLPRGNSHSSGTRRDAFGAVLASVPPTPALLAACLVHELQHTKLAALSELAPLHTADGTRRYWAPWRTDPRPFDGLLHGAYAHLALADHWQRLARGLAAPLHRQQAWAEHSRCWEQVGAVLPTLLGSPRLTLLGRIFLTEMSQLHARMARHPPPEGHRESAAAQVEAAHIRWRRQRGE